MNIDAIVEVGIDEQERLYVRPGTATFPFIYREAVGVNWEPNRHHLHSPKPHDWTYLQWFQNILSAAALQSWDLQLTPSTQWRNIPAELIAEMQRICSVDTVE
jgi:hypothetical protein